MMKVMRLITILLLVFIILYINKKNMKRMKMNRTMSRSHSCLYISSYLFSSSPLPKIISIFPLSLRCFSFCQYFIPPVSVTHNFRLLSPFSSSSSCLCRSFFTFFIPFLSPPLVAFTSSSSSSSSSSSPISSSSFSSAFLFSSSASSSPLAFGASRLSFFLRRHESFFIVPSDIRYFSSRSSGRGGNSESISKTSRRSSSDDRIRSSRISSSSSSTENSSSDDHDDVIGRLKHQEEEEEEDRRRSKKIGLFPRVERIETLPNPFFFSLSSSSSSSSSSSWKPNFSSTSSSRSSSPPPPSSSIPRSLYLYTDDVDEATYEQLRSLTRQPYLVGHVAAMPDVHLGKGATIGSVFASRDWVCPNAVGVDIGCGICAVPLEDLHRSDLSEEKLQRIQREVKRRIPCGFNFHDDSLKGSGEIIKRIKDEVKPSTWLLESFTSRHLKQLGTLGGGNHFLELLYDETDNRVWMMLHSGSRNLGKITAEHYDDLAVKQNHRYLHSSSSSVSSSLSIQKLSMDCRQRGLAFLNLHSIEGINYIKDMNFCLRYARENRRFMMKMFSEILYEITKKRPIYSEEVNIHHNYCQREKTQYIDETTGKWVSEDLWVTRKGATSAKTGEYGIIPGSMGKGSYITRGLGNAYSWQSCSHGAGRKLSRTAAKKNISQRDFQDSMKGIVCDTTHKVRDEAPQAYKEIGEVMRNQKSLVQVVHRLLPLVNVKGF